VVGVNHWALGQGTLGGGRHILQATCQDTTHQGERT
jgi:hypothetical protein